MINGMKYAARYGPTPNKDEVYFPTLPESADEIVIWYRPSDSTLPDFLAAARIRNQIVSITLEDELTDKTLLFFGELHNKYDNFKLRSTHFKEDCAKCKAANIPCYAAEPANNWRTLYSFIYNGATDVIVSDELEFALPTVRQYCKEEGVAIRCIPNYAWRTWQTPEPITTAFIRPEDIDIYAPYVDVFEFASCSSKEQDIVADVYFNQKKWFGDLNEIIYNLGEKRIDNRSLEPSFGQFRLNCEQSCLNSKHYKCSICKRVHLLSSTLNKKNLYYPRKKMTPPKKKGEEQNGDKRFN